MLDGIPKRQYPKIFLRYVKELVEVLIGRTSLKVYLWHNYPNFFKAEFKEGDLLKYEGQKICIPKLLCWTNTQNFGFFLPLIGQYSINKCCVYEGDIVFDIGAHFGFFSYFALQNGAKEIYSFEPNPHVFGILKKHAEIWDKRILPHQLALSSSQGEIDFYVANDLGTASTLLSNREGTILEPHKYREKVIVKTTTIDTFVKENNIERVDFIKIDAEGSEREIIKGAKETIKKFKPRMAISAYHLPDDKEKIPELVLSIRDDYRYKLVNKGEDDLFFY